MEDKAAMRTLLKKFLNPRKTPRLIQMEASECGAAALGIILGYYRKYIPLEELRETCNVSRDGINLEDMNRAAVHYGLEVEVFETPLEELKETSLPAILYWDYNHFIVLEEFSDGKVLINDPSMGHRSITWTELSKSYSGLVMECRPGKDFQPTGARDGFVKRIKGKFLPFKSALRYFFWIQLALATLGLSLPVFTQIFIDQFFGEILPTWEWKFLGLFLGVVILSGLLTWIQSIFLNILQVRIAIQLSTEFLYHILRLPLRFFTQRFGSELINRMSLNNQIGEILTSDLILNVLNILLLSSYWVIMLFYNVPITIVAACIATCNLALVWYIGKTRSNSYAKLQQAEAKAVGISFDALEHIETMKGNSNENFFFSRLAKCYT
ncbi:MAG: Lactococcin-G-processing and transport ATP-binding protein LagD, partial [Chlamydiae bacterium]|nr:Lactococcin-G-processing and transport ATP-binding protein LagD [Chlamydiota bacterium]